MASEWQESTLGDLIDVRHGFAFRGQFIHDEPRGDILLTPANFAIGGGFKGDKFKYYAGPVPEDFLLAEGDLLVTMTDLSKQSDTLGFPAFVPSRSDGCRYLHNQRLGKVHVKDARAIDTKYLHYLLCTADYRHEVLASATGTTVKHTSPERIRRYCFLRPRLHEQRAIAHILTTLDDKIELNRRMKETVEAMARALFKSWFVDFDPVRAKAEGRDPGLAKPLADLFPARLVDSELGEIPEGWSLTSVGDVCSRVAMGPFGSDIKTENFVESGVPVVRGANLVDGFVDDHFVFLTEAKADDLKNANAFPGDLVITHRGTLGQVGFIPHNSRFPRYVVSQSQMLLTIASERSLPRYVYMYLRSPAGQHALLANTSQTGVPAIARPTSSVRAIPLMSPCRSVLEAIGRAVEPLFERWDQAVRESRTLAALRDALLPKLISGELRVRDAERFAAGV